MKAAIQKADSFDGAKIRDAIENDAPLQGTAGAYAMSPRNHQGITKNPFFVATIVHGKVTIVECRDTPAWAFAHRT